MPSAAAIEVMDQLDALRSELVEQAYALERQGRLDAADVTIALSYRLAGMAAGMAEPRRLTK